MRGKASGGYLNNLTTKACLGIQLIIVCIVFSPQALACSLAAWSGGSSGAVSVSDPDNGDPSVSGACGFKVTGMGHVQDNSPSNEDTFVGRFYFYPQFADTGIGITPIFIAYFEDGLSELFSIGFNGTNVSFDGTSSGGNFVSVPLEGSGWHLIEFSWSSGNDGALWLDSDATQTPPTAVFSSGNGNINSIRLGAPEGYVGLTGSAFFDNYASTRFSAIGGILEGDANLDEVLDSTDIDAVKSRFLFGTYSEGSTDCNLDGNTNSGDVNCVVEQP